MKKIILAAIAVTTVGFANAQDIKFGLKGGVNLSNFTGDYRGLSSRVGFQFGGFMEYSLSEKFSIQPELLYSSQGAKLKDSSFDSSYENKTNVNYLNIPVMFKYYVVDKLSIEAGPQIGFLIGGKTKDDVTFVGGEKYSQSYNSKDDFKTLDFGLNFGAGYDFTEKISLGLRYNLGLANIADYGNNFKGHNSVFSLSVGYEF